MEPETPRPQSGDCGQEEVVEFCTVPVSESNKAECTSLFLSTKFHCDFCGRDLSREVRIRDTKVREYDLCVDCFSAGVERGDHKQGHDYRVIEPPNFPILSSDWSGVEELLLLEGIEFYGPGNWPFISEHIGTKTEDEARAHYHEFYLRSSRGPLPVPLDRAELEKKQQIAHPAPVGSASDRPAKKEKSR
mmetsp:Transcript_31780/g.82925  ORF Transcript_31780/g.82925 Transcript_31780/m.82925 type:complete len:190 (-) Transcript_31780:1789-2358(-)